MAPWGANRDLYQEPHIAKDTRILDHACDSQDHHLQARNYFMDRRDLWGNFDGQGVKALAHQVLQGGVDLAVALNMGFTCEEGLW
jgi:hypothetical protein